MKHKYLLAYMDMAERFALTSEAKRLKVGALIIKEDRILSLGVNGQPSGWHMEECEDEEGNTLSTVRHAEQACLDKMVRSNDSAEGGTMVVTHSPCLPCALRIVDARIKEVYYRTNYRDSSGIEYLKKKGVVVTQI